MAANIGAPVDLVAAAEAGAESVGLVRTELLYLDRDDLPSEEEQRRDAIATVEYLRGRVATFRTLDVGGDKLPASLVRPIESNPSLGVRGLRLSLTHPDIFRVQLRALYCASAVGPLRIMFPLVSEIEEMVAARAICADVCADLMARGVPTDAHVPLGAMIETPSAALTIEQLAECCDFFSIGTNDLMQYTFAADRENHGVSYLRKPLHPAFLRLLARAIEDARIAGKPISICGDMAGDPANTWALLGFGARSLSVAPLELAIVRAVIETVSLPEAETLATALLSLRTATEVERRLAVVRARLP
jgi:phosphotransferase system enzyme I (PtsI)